MNTMESTPLVSVLMTVYNREKYMGEAIESVLASTYQNIELIIVDDRSKDASVDIAKSYAKRDERVKVYVNDQNLGDYPNRNQAATYAKGKYLKYVDADDVIYDHTIDYMVRMLETYKQADWATFSVRQNPLKPHPYVLSPEEQYKGHYIEGLGYFSRSPLSVMMKRESYLDKNGFSNKRMVGDFDMWNKLGQSHNLLVLPHSHGFVWYRVHDDQQSNDMDKFEKVYKATAISYLEHEACPLSESDRKLALEKIDKMHIRKILRNIATLNFKQLRHLVK